MDEKTPSPIQTMSDLSGSVVRFGLTAEKAGEAFSALGRAAAALKPGDDALLKELQSKRPWYRRWRW